MITGLLRDSRYAIRALGREPGFTAVIVITLAVGIGATATIFSAVDAVLLKAAPFAEPARVVNVFTVWARATSNANGGDQVGTSAYPDYAELRDSGALEGLAAFAGISLSLDAAGVTDRIPQQRSEAHSGLPALHRRRGEREFQVDGRRAIRGNGLPEGRPITRKPNPILLPPVLPFSCWLLASGCRPHGGSASTFDRQCRGRDTCSTPDRHWPSGAAIRMLATCSPSSAIARPWPSRLARTATTTWRSGNM